ncbi:GNAT family N-acetyltransferase [Pseudoalteromonas sp.]|jgi:predicted GNAT family acetyltransferase|uniref:GNAT family N-acetyltransferase n=1 Tax=Pseudoalteromonas sp. TaxID=53249 RepID=UPI003569685F
MYLVKQLAPIKTALVNKFYAQHSVRGRANKQDQLWVVYHNNNIVAAARVQHKAQLLLLSTVFVAAQYRGQGLAKMLLKTLLSQQPQTLYTFAYHNVVDLYLSLGFNLVLTYNPALLVLFDTYKHRNIVALEYRSVEK